MLLNLQDPSREPTPQTGRAPFPWLMSERARDHYRRVAALLTPSLTVRTRVRLGVTSCYPGEGVTFTAARLACAWAERGSDVTVVEASTASHTLAKEFGLGPPKGPEALTNLTLRLTTWPNLSVAARESSTREEVGRWLDERSSAVTIVDCEALASGPQLLELAPHLDGFVLVVAAGVAQTRYIRSLVRDATRTGLPCFGTILNRVR